MSTSQYRPSAVPPASQRPQAFNAPVVSTSNAPAGTFAPGTKVQVGKHRVVIERYLSEGGFAHVYSAHVIRQDGTTHPKDVAVLKRVAVPDKDQLANMRTEVETMKKLKGHKHIVMYIDSHASQLKGGGYEVFLLMEYCQGGGLIDFMNTRLQHRLTEPEILGIFADVAEGVAAMHYLVPPLLHRDLKVENVLISTSNNTRIYKLCDFGSTAPPRPAASTAAEGRLIEDDVQRHTTMQYRSPEMIDVYRKQPIDEKSDIWALGVLLYKLCYYTTPFEEQGQMAILNATFKYPSYPQFSDRLKRLIGSMLREKPSLRPNIYQLVKEVAGMRGTEVPIKDEMPPPSPTATSPPAIGLQKASPTQEFEPLPEITPMRRGRPTAPAPQSQRTLAGHTPSPMRGTSSDPFAALDSTNPEVRAAAADELAAKFPSLDEFSLLHDKGTKFQFGQSAASAPASASAPVADPKHELLQKRVTQALADDAFAQPAKKADTAPASKVPSAAATGSAKIASTSRLQNLQHDERSSSLPLRQQASQEPKIPVTKITMVSTGVGSSPPPSPPPAATKVPEFKNRPLYRFPEALARSRSANARSGPRPASVYVERNIDFLRDRESGRLSAGMKSSPIGQRVLDSSDDEGPEDLERKDSNIHDNVEYLRQMEDEAGTGHHHHPLHGAGGAMKMFAKKDRRSSSGGSKHGHGHAKRSSLGAMAGGLSKTNEIIKGKFGDAFRKFESNKGSERDDGLLDSPPASPNPDDRLDSAKERERYVLTPIAGSDAPSSGPRSDINDDFLERERDTTFDRQFVEEQDLSPEVRRELERQRLAQEEKRVEAAREEHRRRVAAGGAEAGESKASTIQKRVLSLLDEADSKGREPPRRTAEGYGRFNE
ncbi:kinase-like protein, partial [Rhizodiscina lignyota]